MARMFGVTVEGVVVETHFCINRHQSVLARLARDQAKRVDFHQTGVRFPPGLVKGGEEFGPGGNQIAFQAERDRQFPALVRHEAHGGINGSL